MAPAILAGDKQPYAVPGGACPSGHVEDYIAEEKDLAAETLYRKGAEAVRA